MIPEKDIKRYLANVKTSLAVEGFNMKRRSVVYGRKYLRGHMTSEVALNAQDSKLIKMDIFYRQTVRGNCNFRL